MTRAQLRSAIDHILGISSPERVLRELQSSMIRSRTSHPRRMREFRAADLNAIGNVFRQLRTAAEKSGSRR